MPNKVKIFALSTCPYCRRTKRFLTENGVEYDAVDVDLLDDAERERVLKEVEKLTGRRSFPVAVVGSETIVGHDEKRLKKVLGL